MLNVLRWFVPKILAYLEIFIFFVWKQIKPQEKRLYKNPWFEPEQTKCVGVKTA